MPARHTLDVWPAVPLFIFCHDVYSVQSADNIIAILERSDHVCQINLMNVQGLPLETVCQRCSSLSRN